MSFPRYPKYKDSGVEWLGEVPAHWDVLPIKAVATCNDDLLDEKTPDDFEIDYVEISDVDAIAGITGKTTVPFGTAPSRARRKVRNGDVLVSTVRTYLRAIAQVTGDPENMIASTGFAVIRPREVHSDYLGYACRAEYLIAEVIARSVGVSYPAINAGDLMRLKIPIPSVDEQWAVAKFLSAEVGKIDGLMAEQEKLIALLKEKRQAVISHAVTKGLDPNVPMKDSGIECLGKIPAHWDVVSVRRIIRHIEQGWSPECFSRPADEDEWGILKAGCVNRGALNENENKALPPELEPAPEYEVRAGDVLMSRASGSPELVGSTAYIKHVRPRLMLSDKIFRLSVESHVDPEYFSWIFNSRPLRFQIERSISGAGGLANNLPQSSMLAFYTAVPPLDEQLEIVRHLDSQVERFDELIAEAGRGTDLLKERRTSLISETVTGKINVTCINS